MSDVPTTLDRPLPARPAGRDRWVLEVDGHEVALSNLAKPYWGPEGYTKADLVAWYLAAADRVLPYLADRPLTLKRMPDGADGDFFYAKQAPPGTPGWVRTAPVVSLADGKRVDYVVAGDTATLVWLANAGCIELHPWHSRVDDLGRPDYAFFDLDPMGGATFADVREVALLVRTVLDRLGLVGLPRTSGATGMQVYLPLDRVHSYGTVRAFVGRVCELIHRADPRRTTMTWDTARRGDTVFLDHNMNTEGKNIAATWCVRPERGAPVATPVTWAEVEAGVEPRDSTIATAGPRLAAPDVFRRVLAGGQRLAGALDALGLVEEPAAPRHRLATAVPTAGAGAPGGRLAAYTAMRDFTASPEPGPETTADGDEAGVGGPRFVVQHHLATRLHHDLRLERDGVAESWALPHGLPEHDDARHLAVRTEDHPLGYLDFEGTIPAGQYGAGAVRRYDAGRYTELERTPDKRTFALHGRRHTATYHLFRTGEPIADGTGEQWMVTRRRGTGAAAPPPVGPVAPMLAVAHPAAFDDDAWLFELKWDGVRVIATTQRPGHGRPHGTRLRSRAGNDITGGYPELAGLWERVVAADAVLDGEIVALDPAGHPSFERLQGRMHLRDEAARRAARRTPVQLVVFDLLAADGEDLTGAALTERLARLERVLVPGGAVQRSAVVGGGGLALFAAAEGNHLEGIVAKRASSRYTPGRRSAAWRKVKVRQRAEFVVGGWEPGEGARSGTLGALLVGVPVPGENGRLRFCGRVGTGFDDAELRRLQALLAGLEQPTSPFTGEPAPGPKAKAARWCRPELVVAVEYADTTASGKLRSPSYCGTRS